MKKLSAGFLMGLFAVVGSAQATGLRYHPNHLFVKMKAGESLVKSPLIKSAKRVFGSTYLVKTSNADLLASELASESAIEYTEKDFFAGKSILPKHEVLDEAGLMVKRLQQFDFKTSFNDPDASKLWAFNAKAGLDVEGAYDALPARDPKEIIVAVVDTG